MLESVDDFVRERESASSPPIFSLFSSSLSKVFLSLICSHSTLFGLSFLPSVSLSLQLYASVIELFHLFGLVRFGFIGEKDGVRSIEEQVVRTERGERADLKKLESKVGFNFLLRAGRRRSSAGRRRSIGRRRNGAFLAHLSSFLNPALIPFSGFSVQKSTLQTEGK